MSTTKLKILASALALPLLIGAAPATPESQAHSEAREFWTDHGLSEEIQDALVSKIEETGTLDAFNAFAVPVSVKREESTTHVATVSTFGDGSISVTETEVPNSSTPGSIQPRGISGCQGSSGSGYVLAQNCVVSADDGYRTLSFKANYAAYSNNTAEITSAWGPVFKATLGTMTTPTKTLSRPKATSTQDAVVKYGATWTSYNNASSETIYLALWLTRSAVPTVGRS